MWYNAWLAIFNYHLISHGHPWRALVDYSVSLKNKIKSNGGVVYAATERFFFSKLINCQLIAASWVIDKFGFVMVLNFHFHKQIRNILPYLWESSQHRLWRERFQIWWWCIRCWLLFISILACLRSIQVVCGHKLIDWRLLSSCFLALWVDFWPLLKGKYSQNKYNVFIFMCVCQWLWLLLSVVNCLLLVV